MVASDDYVKELRKAAIEKAVADLVKERRAAALAGKQLSKTTYGAKVECLCKVGVDITIAALKMRTQRMLTAVPDIPPIEISTGSSVTTASSLSPSSNSANSPSSSSSPSNDNSPSPSNSDKTSSKAGRPAGSTNANKKKKDMNYKKCLTSITDAYATELVTSRAPGRRMKKGFLKELIEEKKADFGVTADIPLGTIRSRFKRNRHDPKHPGPLSPLEEAEKALVVICIQMQKIRQPLSCSEGISLMNDLIKDTDIQDALKEFQMVRKLGGDDFEYGTATAGWWSGFHRRQGHNIVSKRGERFAKIRADWTKRSNLVVMFDVIYDEMVDAGVAEYRDEPVFTDRDGKEVEESEAFGFEQNIKITHPEYILFADETGCNTSQKQDGNVGGKKYMVGYGTGAQIQSSTTDHRFTLLPFTSATGKAVCCVIIFQSESEDVPINWKTGIDVTIEDPTRDGRGNIDFEKNMGPGKYYPGGPKCMYNGKQVDCLTYASKSGGITGKILVEVLTYFDEIQLFPREPGGPKPMLIVDGHQSRLDPTFINYINDDRHKWKVCFGVPYATSLWQVGDAAEQNGKFKIEWYREKDELIKYKSHYQQSITLKPEDVMPLMNKIFHKSYDVVEANLKAASDRGWYPPNRKLLDHPSLEDDTKTPIQNASNDNMEPSETTLPVPALPALNVDDGMGAAIFDRLLDHRARSEGAKKAAEERKRKGENISQCLKEAKKLSTGVCVKHGIHSLDHPDFLKGYNARLQEATEKSDKQVAFRKSKNKKRIEGVRQLREEFGHESIHRFEKFTITQCGTYLQYKKQSNKDPAMPKDLDERRKRCIQWMNRPSPVTSPNTSDDEGGDDDGGIDQSLAVESLLGLASGELGGNGNSNEEEDWGGNGEDIYMFDEGGA